MDTREKRAEPATSSVRGPEQRPPIELTGKMSHPRSTRWRALRRRRIGHFALCGGLSRHVRKSTDERKQARWQCRGATLDHGSRTGRPSERRGTTGIEPPLPCQGSPVH